MHIVLCFVISVHIDACDGQGWRAILAGHSGHAQSSKMLDSWYRAQLVLRRSSKAVVISCRSLHNLSRVADSASGTRHQPITAVCRRRDGQLWRRRQIHGAAERGPLGAYWHRSSRNKTDHGALMDRLGAGQQALPGDVCHFYQGLPGKDPPPLHCKLAQMDRFGAGQVCMEVHGPRGRAHRLRDSAGLAQSVCAQREPVAGHFMHDPSGRVNDMRMPLQEVRRRPMVWMDLFSATYQNRARCSANADVVIVAPGPVALCMTA
jgi:hypothetical protein